MVAAGRPGHHLPTLSGDQPLVVCKYVLLHLLFVKEMPLQLLLVEPPLLMLLLLLLAPVLGGVLVPIRGAVHIVVAPGVKEVPTGAPVMLMLMSRMLLLLRLWR